MNPCYPITKKYLHSLMNRCIRGPYVQWCESLPPLNFSGAGYSIVCWRGCRQILYSICPTYRNVNFDSTIEIGFLILPFVINITVLMSDRSVSLTFSNNFLIHWSEYEYFLNLSKKESSPFSNPLSIKSWSIQFSL